jgi:hypothetical protein
MAPNRATDKCFQGMPAVVELIKFLNFYRVVGCSAAPSPDRFTLSHLQEGFTGRRLKRRFQTEPTQPANLRLLRPLPAKRVQDQLDAVGNS